MGEKTCGWEVVINGGNGKKRNVNEMAGTKCHGLFLHCELSLG